MKALSLWQPWASLIVWGEKQYETRNWKIPYRGLLAIHAAKRKPHYNDTAHMKDLFYPACQRNQSAMEYGLSSLPLGAMLCICELKAIYRTEDVSPHISASERAFGDYSPGRAAWELKVVEIFDRPIPAIGRQGIFNWEVPQ